MTLEAVSSCTTKFEQVDSLPVVLTILMQIGWLAVIFLAYILTKANHKMCPVQEWVDKHRYTLERLTGQTIRPTDFTDDRLADVLRYISGDELWWRIEQDLGRRMVRVYRLETSGPCPGS